MLLPTLLGEAFHTQGWQSCLELEGRHLRQYTAFLMPGLEDIYTRDTPAQLPSSSHSVSQVTVQLDTSGQEFSRPDLWGRKSPQDHFHGKPGFAKCFSRFYHWETIAQFQEGIWGMDVMSITAAPCHLDLWILGAWDSRFSTLKNHIENIQSNSFWKVLGTSIYGQLSQLSFK